MTFAKVSNTVFLIYHPFKEDRFWHSWHRHLLTTARSHNVDNVLNLTYSPVTLEDTALLAEQQHFVFSILEQKVGDATITDLPLITAAGFVHTHRGPAIVLLHQCAHYGKGHTIHSTAQIRSFGTQVHDHSPRSQGGQQRLITSEGYHIPLSYCSGLPYMDMRPPTDDELKQLPHIILTSDAVWDPSCLDDEFSFDEIAQDAPFDPASLDLNPRVTATRQYTGNLSDDIDLLLADCCQTRQVSHSVTMAQPDLA